MPFIEFDDVIKEYWHTVKHQYPYLDYRGFEMICKTPFDYVRHQMAIQELPTILVKYLGKFKVYAATVRHNIIELRDRFKRGVVEQEEFEVLEKRYMDKLVEIELHDANKKERIKTWNSHTGVPVAYKPENIILIDDEDDD